MWVVAPQRESRLPAGARVNCQASRDSVMPAEPPAAIPEGDLAAVAAAGGARDAQRGEAFVVRYLYATLLRLSVTVCSSASKGNSTHPRAHTLAGAVGLCLALK